MTLLEIHEKNKRLQQIRVKVRRERRVYLEKWCLHCLWKNTGSPCVLPRCFRREPKKGEASHDKETL